MVSWGESTFIQGGINVINPVDLSKLRVAGAELKEAFEGVNMIWGSIDLTPSVALEGLYMFEHREIRPDPAGSYFSTNDIGSPGATYAMLGFVYPQPVVNPDLYQDVCKNQNYGASDSQLPPELVAVGCGLSLQRSETNEASDSGQFGLALRWFLENLGGTELVGFAAGGAAVVGHCFPIWHRFKGGKGVATTVGVLLWTIPALGLVLAALWAGIIAVSRTASLGSLVLVALAVPGVLLWAEDAWSAAVMAAIATLVFVRHGDNIRRLLGGEEQPI